MSLTAEQILAADDRPIEELEVPEWGGSVFIRTMSGDERDSFEADMVQNRSGDPSRDIRGFRAKLAAHVLCDESGSRLFTDAQIKELGAKSAAALDRVMMKAQSVNRMSNEDIEELAGN